jgi:probable HAF family extracellular repeat protein
VSALGEVAGVSTQGGGLHVARWPSGSSLPSDVGIGTPYDINITGQIAGEFGVHAALWTPGGPDGYTRTNIGEQLPSAVESRAYSINANGQVVGTYRAVPPDGGVVDKCFLWTPDKPNAPTGTVTTLPDFGGRSCVAYDVNSTGHVVGAATTSGGETHGFIWSPSINGRLAKIRDLTPGGGPSYATSINDSRTVAGQHVTETGGIAAIWTPSPSGSYVMTHLGTSTGNESFAMDINDAGFVVGYVRHNRPPYGDDAFFWQNGEFTLLFSSASFSEATALTGMNGNSVQVVGASVDEVTGGRTALRWNLTLAPSSSSPK